MVRLSVSVPQAGKGRTVPKVILLSNFSLETVSQTGRIVIPAKAFFFFYLDLNECGQRTSMCSNGGTCINQIGSFVCHCKSGWTGNSCTQGKQRFRSRSIALPIFNVVIFHIRIVNLNDRLKLSKVCNPMYFLFTEELIQKCLRAPIQFRTLESMWWENHFKVTFSQTMLFLFW